MMLSKVFAIAIVMAGILVPLLYAPGFLFSLLLGFVCGACASVLWNLKGKGK